MSTVELIDMGHLGNRGYNHTRAWVGNFKGLGSGNILDNNFPNCFEIISWLKYTDMLSSENVNGQFKM